MISGAREAPPSRLRRLVARAAARDLRAFVVPGPEVARARGLDLEAAGLRLSDTPRHASVLVLVGELPAGLKKAAAVAYAQMPRPRAIFAVGAGDVSPLPDPDVSVPLDQEDVASGVGELRRSFAEGAFAPEAPNFDVDAIRTQTEYVCPMHPEVVRGEPGSCPICGMDLVPREAAGDTDHGQMDHERSGHEGTDHGGMDHGGAEGHDGVGHEHTQHGDARAAGEGEEPRGEYTCPMHPEVVRDEPGSCPVCGMDLVPREAAGGAEHGDAHNEHETHEHGEAEPEEHDDHHGHEETEHADPGGEHGAMEHVESDHEGHDHEGHGGHEHTDHGDMGFMSMVEMTKDLPRSSDGLQMEWVEAPFGPLFPGLPGGLNLTLTLDGDTVAEATPGIEGWSSTEDLSGPAERFADRLALLDPLAPVAYRVLALRALEDAADVTLDERTPLGRVGAMEHERASSHLNWLATFAHLLGYGWLERRAGELQLALLRATDAEEMGRLAGEARKLARRVGRTPLLRRKLKGIGPLPGGARAFGPVARAGGSAADARATEGAYRELGFESAVRDGNDALSRLLVRIAEIQQSLDLVRKAGSVSTPEGLPEGAPTGTGTATVETPRGAATLRVILDEGAVSAVELETPSTAHLGLVEDLVLQQELADALVGVASLDLSPWEVLR